MLDKDILLYFEPLDQYEKFYQKYYEYKNDREKLRELLRSEDNYSKYRLPEVFPDISFFRTTTLTDSEYTNDIAIRKHRRYGPMFFHNHTFVEINYVLSGSADNTINGKYIKMTEGDLCFIKPRF